MILVTLNWILNFLNILQVPKSGLKPHDEALSYVFFLYFCTHSHSNIETKYKTNKIVLAGVSELIKDEFRSTRI